MTELEKLEQDVDQAISQNDIIELRAELNEIVEESSAEVAKIPLRKRILPLTAAAAVILLLISSGIFMFSDNGFMNSDSVKYSFDKFVGPGEARGAEATQERAVQYAYSAYLDGRYEEAVRHYNVIEDHQEDNPDTWIYQGLSLYEIEQTKKAKAYFKKVLYNGDNAYLEEAEWYLIGCLLREGEVIEASARLNRILALQQHDHQVEASKLLKKIKRMN